MMRAQRADHQTNASPFVTHVAGRKCNPCAGTYKIVDTGSVRVSRLFNYREKFIVARDGTHRRAARHPT